MCTVDIQFMQQGNLPANSLRDIYTSLKTTAKALKIGRALKGKPHVSTIDLGRAVSFREGIYRLMKYDKISISRPKRGLMKLPDFVLPKACPLH